MKQQTHKLSSAVNSLLMKLCKTRRIELKEIVDSYVNSKVTDRENKLSNIGFVTHPETIRYKEKIQAKKKFIEKYEALPYILNSHKEYELLTPTDINELCISCKLKSNLISEYVGDIPDFAIDKINGYMQIFKSELYVVAIPELFIKKYSLLLGDTIVLSNINPWRSNNDDNQTPIYSLITSWGNG